MKNREQILALDGGRFIVEAIEAIEDDVARALAGLPKTGNGSPTSAVLGSVGDLYLRKNGGTTSTLYVKESGSNTAQGWVAK